MRGFATLGAVVLAADPRHRELTVRRMLSQQSGPT